MIVERMTIQRSDGRFSIANNNGSSPIQQTMKIPFVIDRLGAIEDILGDDYDLDRLRELIEADRDGRCVVLSGKSKKNETIRDLVQIIEWISDSVKKHDFSPFRIVAGAPENTFPVVREYQRVIEKHEEEIYLAFKDKEVGNYLKGDRDG